MGSFRKVKSSAKVLAFIGEIAYNLFVKTDVNRPIPTLASSPFVGNLEENSPTSSEISSELEVFRILGLTGFNWPSTG
jgi:hypothetical protein